MLQPGVGGTRHKIEGNDEASRRVDHDEPITDPGHSFVAQHIWEVADRLNPGGGEPVQRRSRAAEWKLVEAIGKSRQGTGLPGCGSPSGYLTEDEVCTVVKTFDSWRIYPPG